MDSLNILKIKYFHSLDETLSRVFPNSKLKNLDWGDGSVAKGTCCQVS